MVEKLYPQQDPWNLTAFTEREVLALKSVALGAANSDQQKFAFDTIIKRIAGTYDTSFRPDQHGGARATDFAEGRRFVGLELIRAVQFAPINRGEEQADATGSSTSGGDKQSTRSRTKRAKFRVGRPTPD